MCPRNGFLGLLLGLMLPAMAACTVERGEPPFDPPAEDAGVTVDRGPWADLVKEPGPCSAEFESCNGIDDNCNGEIDEGLFSRTFYRDADGDGHGGNEVVNACQAPPGYVTESGDCDDSNADINPNASESCNQQDDNCNGLVDEGVPVSTYFADGDGDGHGNDDVTKEACAPPVGFVISGGDCNDTNPAIHPGAVEVCNHADDNCDGVNDEGLVRRMYFKDRDGDKFGGDASVLDCQAPGTDWVTETGDCNDNNSDINPSATESCNQLDDDCDGHVDEDVQLRLIYRDTDGDGIAPKNAVTQQHCAVLPGWTIPRDVDGDGDSDWDCDDSDVTVFPGATAVCADGKDNNCDGYVDRFCFTGCGGQWQRNANAGGQSSPIVFAQDLDGDGIHEVVVSAGYHFSIRRADGSILHDDSQSRSEGNPYRSVVFADADNYDSFSQLHQSMEVYTVAQGRVRIYKLKDDGTVEHFDGAGGLDVWTDGLIADVDGDGSPEYLATPPTSAVRIERFDKAQQKVVTLGTFADPQSKLQHHDGRLITDIDGDGRLDFVFGNGKYADENPASWSGAIQVLSQQAANSLRFEPKSCATCFPTSTQSGFYPGWVTRLYRSGNEIHAATSGYKTKNTGKLNARANRYFRFSTAGDMLAPPGTQFESLYHNNVDVDDDGTMESESAMMPFGPGLFDVNGDGYPDKIVGGSRTLSLWLWDPDKKAYVESVPARHGVGDGTISVRAIWDIDKDGRLEVISGDNKGKVYCHRLGRDTFHREGSLPPMFTPVMRTNQRDNFEPNEGADLDKDGVPDQVIRVPSTLTSSGGFYSYLSHADDKDYFMVQSGWAGRICVTAPRARRVRVRVYARKYGNRPAGLVKTFVTATGKKACFSGQSVSPQRIGEYRFIVRVEPYGADDYSSSWPYWIDTP